MTPALALGLAGALAIGMTQPQPSEMSLESLIITHDGKPRIVLGTNPEDGGVGIGCLDLEGKARAIMGTDTKGDGGFAVFDKKESPKILMGDGPGGAGIMIIGGSLTEFPAMPEAPKK